MGTLILIRHGRTHANAQGVLAGRSAGVELDEVGIKSCENLRDKFSGLNVKHVATSPLERTQQTASLVFPENSFSIEENLTECDYGDWTGKKLADLANEPLWQTVRNAPHEVIFPAGESMQAMSDRAISAVLNLDQKLTEIHGDEFIWAAISHGDIIKAIIAHALGLELAKFQRIYVEPASVSVLRIKGDDTGVLKVNDTGDGWVQSLAKVAEPTVGGQTGQETTK